MNTCQTPMTCHSFHKEKLSDLTMEVEKTLGKRQQIAKVVWVEILRDRPSI